jgi:DeoR/GlpR family transcriptional regulator of sugar metabolism
MQQSANAFERHMTILKLVHESQTVRVVELAIQLDVSESTIRNDLELLQTCH